MPDSKKDPSAWEKFLWHSVLDRSFGHLKFAPCDSKEMVAMAYRPYTRMRVLGLIPGFPYPPHSGTAVRMWNLYTNLAKTTDLTLVCRTRNQVDSGHLKRCTEENLGLRALHIPRPSLYEKLTKGLSFFVGLKPITAAGWYFPEVARQIADMIRAHDFDVIVMESTFMGVYWQVISNSRAMKALDLNDLHSERARRQAAILPLGKDKLLYLYDSFIFGRFENQLINKADLVLTISNRERDQITEKHQNKKIRLVPNGVDCDHIRPLPMANDRDLLFVGILDYLPNIDGILFFVQKVLPSLRQKYPHLIFWVVGRNPVPEVMRLQGVNGVEVTGEVPELEPYYRRCRVCVVPLRAGSGSRVKILEAMAYGRPVVSTSLGCEGLDVEHQKHLFIADTPAEMVEAIERVFKGGDLEKAVIQNGRKLVEEKYSWANIARAMHAYFAESTGRS